MISSNMPRQTIKQYFKALTIIHVALAAGAALYLLMAYLLVSKGEFMKESMPGIYLYSIPFFAVGSVIAGIYLFRKELNEVKHFQNPGLKLKAYRAAFIKRDAFFHGPALVCHHGLYAYRCNHIIANCSFADCCFLFFTANKRCIEESLFKMMMQ